MNSYAFFQNVNYVALDWSGGSKNADYAQSAADTQIAGRSIAYMFNELKKEGFEDFSQDARKPLLNNYEFSCTLTSAVQGTH